MPAGKTIEMRVDVAINEWDWENDPWLVSILGLFDFKRKPAQLVSTCAAIYNRRIQTWSACQVSAGAS
jgi:hypothetical protein